MHLDMGYRNLHDYAIRALKYSHSAAHRRVSAAQVIESLPKTAQTETIQALESSKTNLSALVAAKSFFYQEKKSQVRYTPTERAAVIKTLESKVEVKPIRGGKVKYEFLAEVALKNKLDQIKNLIAHRNPNPTMEELIDIMSDIVLKKIDPSRKAPKKKNRSEPAQTSTLCAADAASKRVTQITNNVDSTKPLVRPCPQSRAYKKADIHALWTRAQVDSKPRCEYISSTGQRCESHYGLEIEHMRPFSRGGTNDLSNLKLFCRAHNGHAWKKWKLLEQNALKLI